MYRAMYHLLILVCLPFRALSIYVKFAILVSSLRFFRSALGFLPLSARFPGNTIDPLKFDENVPGSVSERATSPLRVRTIARTMPLHCSGDTEVADCPADHHDNGKLAESAVPFLDRFQ